MRKERGKGNSIKKLAILLMLGVAGFFLIVQVRNRQVGENYSEKAVSLDEVKEELSFGIYEKTDWDAFFSVYHKEYLTGEILLKVLDELGVADYIEMEHMSNRHVVERAEWNALYGQVLDILDMEKTVAQKTLLVLDVLEAEDGSILVTNQGDYTTRLPSSYFSQWQGYQVYCTKERCIGVLSISEDEMYLSNAYLTSYTQGQLSFLYGGASYEKEIGTLGATVEEGVCDIVIKEGNICALRMKKDTISGELLSYDDSTIEIEGYGKIPHPGTLPVYQTYGEITEKSLSNIVLGNMEVTYVTGENEVCAILIGQPAQIQNIRVLLLADDGGNYRREVYLKCDTNATLTCGDRQESLTPQTVVAASDYLSVNSAYTLSIAPDFSEGKVVICDAQGNALSNGYQGTMEVRLYEEGYTLVNDVPFEIYLTAVVPSEMPSSYASEALKAQAVCARSYAYMQLLRADLAKFGAHINDSTSYQVYNKVEATDATKSAVYETAGQMLLYEGQPVEAFYFSTSMGYTDTDEVWNVEETYAYLKSVYLNTTGTMEDLSDEETFLSYISQMVEGYDSDVKYYRWFASADYRDKTEEINQILISRCVVSPQNISFKKAGSSTPLEEVNEKTVAKLGEIVGLSVEERSSAGSILTLCVQYENGKALIQNEYNIRKVLGAGVEKIVYADSTESSSIQMLPSAFCALTEQDDGSILLQGGGYGHGLGMSQNAANGMAKAGMNYEQILQYFYQNIEIGCIE